MREYRREALKNGFNETEMGKEYVQMKICPRNESFTDGSVGVRVRLKRMSTGMRERKDNNNAFI